MVRTATRSLFCHVFINRNVKAEKQLIKSSWRKIEWLLIFEDPLFDLLLNDPNPNVALVAKYESWMDGTMVRLDKENNIINFVPKKAFRYEDTDLYYKTVNVYKL